MLSVVMLNVVMMSVVAPKPSQVGRFKVLRLGKLLSIEIIAYR